MMEQDSSSPVRVAGIVCSPHKDGMTARLTERALAGVQSAGARTFTLFLADDDTQPCRGCGGGCWDSRRCALDPDFAAHHDALQQADALVMAAPVYCWQMNSMTHLFIDKMRWDSGSVLHPRNRRAALGIACAGGSGTGCVLALQALYRYFYNWAFHGIAPLPVTRFNYRQALDDAYAGGQALAAAVREGLEPFPGLGEAMAHLESLPYMTDGPVDELRLIVGQLLSGPLPSDDPLVRTLHDEASLAEEAWRRGGRSEAAAHLTLAYEAGSRAWSQAKEKAEE